MTTAQGVATRIDDLHVDGRTLRRTRNRTAVIGALLDIIREGELHPGAAEIADRAGVSHRSIFRYFDDLDDLVRTAIDQAFEQAKPLAEIPDIGVGTRTERIRSLVESRLELFEHVDATMQLARMRAPSIPAIDECVADIAEFFRRQVAQHFAPEFDELVEHERPLLVDGVLVLTSYDAYTIHLRLLGSDNERIRAAWVSALAAMLS